MNGTILASNPTPQPGPFPYFVEFNGLTKLLTFDLSGLTSGATYTFKIAIADTSDNNLDSGVFIKKISAGNTSNDIDIVAYQLVTPNGDGFNDVFIIENIEFFPENNVKIYNRWGVLVYEVDGYNNKDKSFNGVSNGRVTVKQKELLPDGTYYFVVKYSNSVNEIKEKTSYLYISR